MKLLNGIIVALAVLFAGSANAQLNCPGTDNSLGQASRPITSLPYQLQSNDQCLLKVFNSSAGGVVRIPAQSPGTSFLVSFWNEGPGSLILQPLPNAQGATPLINGQSTIPLATGQGADLNLGKDGNWYANAPAPPQPGSAGRKYIALLPDSGLAPRRNTLTYMQGGEGLAGTMTSQNTHFFAYPAPSSYYGVRIIACVTPVDDEPNFQWSFRPSSSFNDYVNPVDAGSVYTVWQTGSWSTQGADFAQMFEPNQTTSIARKPAFYNPETGVGGSTYRLFVSDWNYVRSLAPTAFPPINAPYPLFVRGLSNVAPTNDCLFFNNPGDNTETGSTYTGNTALNNNQDYSTLQKAGNFLTTNTVITGFSLNTAIPIGGVQFRVLTPAIQVDAFGDSQMQGYKTTSSMSNWMILAVNQLTTPALPISFASSAYIGANSDAFMPGAVDLINLSHPSICVIEGFTSNDSPITTISIARYQLRVRELADRCKDQGAQVIITTPFPRNDTLTGAALAAWQALYVEIISMGNAGYYVFDGLQIVGQFSGGVPTGQWVPAYVSADGIHGNDAAMAVLNSGVSSNGTFPGFLALLKLISGIN